MTKKELEDACIINKLIDDKLIRLYTEKITSEKLADDFVMDDGEAEAVQFALQQKKLSPLMICVR